MINKLVENTFIFPGFHQCDFGGFGRLTGGHRSPIRPWGQTPLSACTSIPCPTLLTPSTDQTSTAASRIMDLLIITIIFFFRYRFRIRTTNWYLNFLLPPNGLQIKITKKADWFLHTLLVLKRKENYVFLVVCQINYESERQNTQKIVRNY